MNQEQDTNQARELEALRRRIEELERKVDESTAALRRVETGANDMLEFFSAAQGAFKVLNWIGKLVKPLGYIAMAVGAVAGAWAALKGGR